MIYEKNNTNPQIYQSLMTIHQLLTPLKNEIPLNILH